MARILLDYSDIKGGMKVVQQHGQCDDVHIVVYSNFSDGRGQVYALAHAKSGATTSFMTTEELAAYINDRRMVPQHMR